MSLTLQDLATRVLRKLALIASDETPSAADALTVKTYYKEWRRLAERRLIIDWYDDEEDIPSGAELAVIFCLCPYVAPEFGLTPDYSMTLQGEGLLAEYMTIHYPRPDTQIVAY